MKKLVEVPLDIDQIEIKKKMSNLNLQANKEITDKKCVLCGRVVKSFCNSHSVPQFSLKNIAKNGMVMHPSKLMGIDVIEEEKGVNKSGTFRFICRECDRSFFQDYEDEAKLKSVINDKMMAQMAVKNTLLQLSKRTFERNLYGKLQETFHAYENIQELFKILELDIREYKEELQFHKDISEKNLTDEYRILFQKLLPYKVPIAFQGSLVLREDLEGGEVNNIFDMSENTKMQFMHLAIFPLQSESVVLAFYHKKDTLYRRLGHQINSISEQQILAFLNYLIFAYTENYYLSKEIAEELTSNEKLQLLSQEVNGMPNMGFLGYENNCGIGYKAIEMNDIPNFLSVEWAIT